MIQSAIKMPTNQPQMLSQFHVARLQVLKPGMRRSIVMQEVQKATSRHRG